MKQDNYPYVFELPTALLWQMGIILYRFKCPYKIDMIDREVCRFYIDMDDETAREVKALLDEQIEEEGLDITRHTLNCCCTVPCALLRQLREALKNGGWEFSVEAVDSDICRVFIDMDPGDFLEMLAGAQEAEENDPAEP